MDSLAWNLSCVDKFFKSNDEIFVKFLLYIFILISTYTFFPFLHTKRPLYRTQLGGLPGCRQGILAPLLLWSSGSPSKLRRLWAELSPLLFGTLGPHPCWLAARTALSPRSACWSSLVTCSFRRDSILFQARGTFLCKDKPPF